MIIDLPKGASVEGAAPIGSRRKVKMVPSMGIYGTNCPILWKGHRLNADGKYDILILVSRDPGPTVMPGEIDQGAYEALPETVVEW